MMQRNKQPTLSDQVEEQIYEYIRRHRLSWDDPLPKEEELATELAVSRTIMREALSRLKAAGVIESRRRRGMVLQRPDFFSNLAKLIRFGLIDADAEREFSVLRAVLEIGLADLVYRNRNPEAIQKLEKIAGKFLTPGLSMDEHNRLETEFHSALFEMSGNDVIASFQVLLSQFFVKGKFSDVLPLETGAHDHKKLVEVLKNGTENEWREIIRRHLEYHLQ